MSSDRRATGIAAGIDKGHRLPIPAADLWRALTIHQAREQIYLSGRQVNCIPR